MSEEYDPKKTFEDYLREKEGQPIDPRAVEAGKREFELGKKGGFAVYGDEPDREKLIASYPKGRLSERDVEIEEEEQDLSTESAILEPSNKKKTVGERHPEINLTEEELQDAISELTVAQRIIASFLEKGKLKQGEIPDKLELVMRKIDYKYGVKATLSDFPKEIEKLIEKYTEALKYFQDKSSG